MACTSKDSLNFGCFLLLSETSKPPDLRDGSKRGDLKAERRIIFKRCMVQYILGGIFWASFKFCMGDKLREKMEGGKRDETFISAL
jgi:hypothetical protein